MAIGITEETAGFISVDIGRSNKLGSAFFQNGIGLQTILHSDSKAVTYFIGVCGRNKNGVRFIFCRSTRGNEQNPMA